MAYQSDESGQYQVYVQTIPVGGGILRGSAADHEYPGGKGADHFV